MFKDSARSRAVQYVMAQAHRVDGPVISGDVPEAVMDAHRASKDKPEPTVLDLSCGVQIRRTAAAA